MSRKNEMVVATEDILKDCDGLLAELMKGDNLWKSLKNAEPEDGPVIIRTIKAYDKLKEHVKLRAKRDDEMAQQLDDLQEMVKSSNAKIEEIYKKVMEG